VYLKQGHTSQSITDTSLTLMINRLFALIALLILSPVFLAVALAIFLEDGSPIFFK
jgi:lipopolysaccharide/colanic/teichoic acid biosynthesis glycosyltransferase